MAGLSGIMTAPQPDAGEVAAIVKHLSEPQKRWLGPWAKFCSPATGHDKRWMTFPPTATLRVLMSYGLCDRSGQIFDLGLAVRKRLQEIE